MLVGNKVGSFCNDLHKLTFIAVLKRISLETRSVAKQVSVAVGWIKIKILLMAQLRGLTAKFKLM